MNSQAVLDEYRQVRASSGRARCQGGIKVYGMFAQDSWRVTPNLTLTGGIRYDVQTPFTPSSNVMSAVTMASICGMSGLGDGGTYSKCNFLKPERVGRRHAGVHPARRRARRATRPT